jgi:alcohol dehydrogenase (NADP+)
MNNTKGYAAQSATDQIAPFSFQRRDVQAHDVQIEILYCGVCHSDIHQARNEWGDSIFPMVPGHEIVGRVTKTGDRVTKFNTGELVGVGCFVDSCRDCAQCKAGQEQYCEKGMSPTYNGYEQDRKTPTFGGYSTQIVVDENYILRVSPKLALEGVAPLLCAGITTYSPLRHWNVGQGHKVGVLGLGGLGHMGVKIAAALGAEVTMLSTSPSKEADARRLGAQRFALTTNTQVFKEYDRYFDFILDTVSASHDFDSYLSTLKTDGTLILVGLPSDRIAVRAHGLVSRRRSISGSMIGGIAETQEMLDFCAAHDIVSDVEVVPIQQINEAYERTIKGDVKYRFVIDIASLKETNG